MSSVEAAASLFGASDSGSDLDFLTAPEGTSSTSESPASNRASDELFASQEAQDSSGLFDNLTGGGTSPSLFGTPGEAEAYLCGQNDTQPAHVAANQLNEHGSEQEPQSSFDYYTDDYAGYAEGWYDEAGQWHVYQQQGTVVTTENNASSHPAEPYTSVASTSSHGVYEPSSFHNTQAVNTSAPYGYQAAYVPSSSAYDPYKPTTPLTQQQASVYDHTATTPSYDQYKPSGATSQQTPSLSHAATVPSPYDPYNSVTPGIRSPSVASPSILPQSNTFTYGGSLIPPPSTPDTSKPPVAPYRPPTANAYDPPLPVIKPKKSLTASAFQYQSSPYAPHSTVSPPPLPPAHSVLSPPRMNSSLPRGAPPPARSPVYSPPKAVVVPYAPPSTIVARSNSPYDPPIGRQYEPPKRHSNEYNTLPSRSQVNGHYSPRTSPSAPHSNSSAEVEQTPYNSGTFAGHTVPPTAPSFGTFAAGIGRASLESSYSPPPISGPYAPSPSLLGTNDPLGRASAKVPVISFGFGGKLVTCFHSPPTLDTGFDVALSSRKCTDIHIRLLHKAIPESALSISSASYPGPLFGDPGSPVTTLARAAGSANAKAKTKKASILAYLNERAEELERGLGYLVAGSVDKRRADGKLSLVRLLHILVEHEGQLHGSPTAESAARTALLPRLANSQDATGANAFLNAPTGASLTAGTLGSANSHEKPLAEYAVRRTSLETIQDFLLRGEKRKAYHYALDEKMWAHAMVISSSVDKEAFKEVVSEFIRTELGVKAESHSEAPVTNGLESLRLAYSLYSGQSSTAVQHLLPIKSLQAGPSLTLQPPTPMNIMTPLSPNFPPPSVATNISPEILSQWPEYAATLFSGQMGTDSSSALTTLGDYLLSNDWVEAAHCCYILSPQSSPIGGVGAPSVRIVLVGSHSPNRNVLFGADPDAFMFSEIVEFALSLHAPAKGQEAFAGFPHLQAFRLIRAFQLAEMGEIFLAKRYCEAITGATFRPSPYLSPVFSDQLRELYSRLNGDPELDKSHSWMSGKLAKPSLDSIGDWLGGTLSKFVAGEAEPSSPVQGAHPAANRPAYAGAFQHFSNISSTNNSRGPSPAPSFANSAVHSGILPGRAGSFFGSVPPYSHSNRASPALDYEGPRLSKSTPPPRVLSADSTKSYNQSQAMGDYTFGGVDTEHHIGNGSAIHAEETEKPQGGWWDAAYGGANNATPTAASFTNVDSQSSEAESGGSGFISLMDNYPPYTPSPSATTFTNSKVEETDYFDDDLGLSTSTTKKKALANQDDSDKKPEEEKEVKKEEAKKPDTKPNASSSTRWPWRWFSREASTNPGPVKANLGEEMSLYFDPELKRWVNKKAGAEPAKSAAPPPPPSRAQTVSPSRHTQLSSAGPPPPSPMPPPARPFSAMESGSSGPQRRTLPPVRSKLVPEEGSTASAPSTPAVMSSLSAPPPTGRPKSAAKKSVRSRYVDVFQQPS